MKNFNVTDKAIENNKFLYKVVPLSEANSHFEKGWAYTANLCKYVAVNANGLSQQGEAYIILTIRSSLYREIQEIENSTKSGNEVDPTS